MKRFYNRIKWFLRLVWRRADRWEPGRIEIKTAWDVGKILENL